MDRRRDKRRKRRTVRILLILILVGAGILIAANLLFVPEPEIALETGKAGIGPTTEIRVRISEPRRGLGDVRVSIRQGERRETLAAEGFDPRPPWKLWDDTHTPTTTLVLQVGKETHPWLVDGEATIRVEADRPATGLRDPGPVVLERTLPVDVTPPRISVLSTQTYVDQGGSEAVVYRVGEEAVRHGVETPELFFSGAPLPGREGESFVLFSAPWNHPTDEGIVLVAEDELGNRARAPFIDRFRPRPVQEGTIRLGDDFLETIQNEMASRYPEPSEAKTSLDAYLWINGELRERNRRRLRELGEESRPEFLWDREFLALPGAQVMDSFAVRRTYLYEGEKVDEQTHLGYDLATVRRDEVPAANDGIVLLAEYLGIYGNCIVVDHGYGLMTLYAHLSSFDVDPGETVTRGRVLGRTGSTGLAGGDHLHFAVLLRGLPVNALEWWDAHWIRDRIDRKLGEALPFGDDS